MYRRMVWPFAVLMAVVSSMRCVASANGSSPCPDPPDAEYLLALGVVDQFLGAWNLRDESKGIEYVSDSLRKRVGDEKLHYYVWVSLTRTIVPSSLGAANAFRRVCRLSNFQ